VLARRFIDDHRFRHNPRSRATLQLAAKIGETCISVATSLERARRVPGRGTFPLPVLSGRDQRAFFA